jgi:tetratricopeptide (TPR) repeat protein
MGRAEIKSHLGGGLYQVDLLYNTELVRFHEERLNLRLQDLQAIDIPEAEQIYLDWQAEVEEKTAEIDELIKRLEGNPTPEMLAALSAAATALESIESALSSIAFALALAVATFDQAQAVLPPDPPPEVLARFADANATNILAQAAVGDERSAIDDADAALSTVQTLVNQDPPNMAAARSAMGNALAKLGTASQQHEDTRSLLTQAQSRMQNVLNALPSEPDYEESRALVEQAIEQIGQDVLPPHQALDATYGEAASQEQQTDRLMQPGDPQVRKEINDTLKALNDVRTQRDTAYLVWQELLLLEQQLLDKLEEYSTIKDREPKELWCADFTEDLKRGTVVGTIEVPGEANNPENVQVIRPAFKKDAAQWQATRDGAITPVQALTPAAYFYNKAMEPGWQVFKPGYRLAIVKAINDDGTLDVGLTFPNVQDLTVTQRDMRTQSIPLTPRSLETSESIGLELEHVPVRYMDCDAQAFTLGDEVVVEFEERDASKPRVIGFRKEPRPCADIKLVCPAGMISAAAGESWTFSSQNPGLYGTTDWQGKKEAVTWNGSYGRLVNPRHTDDLEAKLFYRGQEIATPGKVLGAAMAGTGAALSFVVMVVDAVDEEGQVTSQSCYRQPIGGDWILLGTFTQFKDYNESQTNDTSPELTTHPPNWFFNASGTAAVSTWRSRGAEVTFPDPQSIPFVHMSLSLAGGSASFHISDRVFYPVDTQDFVDLVKDYAEDTLKTWGVRLLVHSTDPGGVGDFQVEETILSSATRLHGHQLSRVQYVEGQNWQTKFDYLDLRHDGRAVYRRYKDVRSQQEADWTYDTTLIGKHSVLQVSSNDPRDADETYDGWQVGNLARGPLTLPLFPQGPLPPTTVGSIKHGLIASFPLLEHSILDPGTLAHVIGTAAFQHPVGVR